MKAISSRWVVVGGIVVFGIGALVLQGCATTASSQADAGTVAAGPTAAAAVPATQSVGSSAAVPEVNGKPVVRADTKDNFEAIVAAIHQQMQPGGRWQYIDRSEQATIDGSFADMRKLYDRFGSVDKMDAAARTRLLTDQQTVNNILTQRDGDRLICQYETPVGSHLPIRTCKTYAQTQAEQRNAQDYLRLHPGTIQNTHN